MEKELQEFVVNVPDVKTVGQLRRYLWGVLMEGRSQIPLYKRWHRVVLHIAEDDEDFEAWLPVALAQVILSPYDEEVDMCAEWLRSVPIEDEELIDDIGKEWEEYWKEYQRAHRGE